MYGFSLTSTSLIWLAVPPAAGIGFVLHCVWLSRRVQPKMRDGTFGDLENFLETGVAASVLMPLSLFMFGKPKSVCSLEPGKLTRSFTI